MPATPATPATRGDLRSGPPVAAVAAVALGGAFGALTRWWLSAVIPDAASGWPWATLVINVSGCAAIGVVLAVLLHRPATAPAAPLVRPLVVTGFLGGYTTWSTFAVEATRLLQAHRAGLAAAYVLCSVLGGVVAVALAARATTLLLHLTRPDAPLPADAEE